VKLTPQISGDPMIESVSDVSEKIVWNSLLFHPASFIRDSSSIAHYGTEGAGFITIVFPASNCGSPHLKGSQNGKFQGIIT
jgi:hypothetical protein